jgi:peptidoglycan/xylan/chitin deacetylase (PgdA/CDA1 family)
MLSILREENMKMYKRWFFQAFIASTMAFLLAFSMLSPIAQPLIIFRNFAMVHADHPLIDRAFVKISANQQSPYLTQLLIQKERMNQQVLRNPRLILSVYREMKEEEQQLKDSLLVKPRLIDPSKPMVALTFDDGPRPSTEKVYASLKKYNVVATFFVIGMYVNGKRDLLKRLVDEGNEIGNHSWSHLNFREISYEEVVSQVVRTDAAIVRAVGIRPNFVRPPMGLFNDKVRRAIGNRQIAMWSIDTLDWKHKNWEKTMAAIVGKVRDGDIILVHDLVDSTASNIEELIVYLIEEGYQLVTMSELVEYRNIDQKVVRYARP